MLTYYFTDVLCWYTKKEEKTMTVYSPKESAFQFIESRIARGECEKAYDLIYHYSSNGTISKDDVNWFQHLIDKQRKEDEDERFY